MKPTHVYVAGPFFTQAQGSVIRNIESILMSRGIDHFSPSRDQPQFRPLNSVDARQLARSIFERNVAELENCDLILACVDGFDPGTIWEMGYAYGYREVVPGRMRIIAFTTQHHGLNIMLAESCDGFLSGYDQIKAYLDGNEAVAQAWKGEVL